MKNYVIGIDFGSDSVRAVLVDTKDGGELGESVFPYPRWTRGLYCNPRENRFRQHPLDYLEGLEATVKAVLTQVPGSADHVRGLAVDTTGSTPCAVDAAGTPLALLPEFQENPNAMFILWKDHTAIEESEEINALARSWGGEDFTKFEGGIYSSEWFWSKILHILRVDETVARGAHSWVEHCDWIPGLLTGKTLPATMYRSRCTAGHKAMWHPCFDGLPSEEFLKRLDPALAGLRERLFRKTETAEVEVGNLTLEWAEKLGLSTEVVVAGSALDAHIGAVGGGIRPKDMIKIVGTSTCDMIVTPTDTLGDTLVEGICGQVDGSILPGMIGLEAGQSSFGDVYAWLKKLLLWPVENLLEGASAGTPEERAALAAELEEKLLAELGRQAEELPIDDTVIALDWFNGRRTPDANPRVKGALTGLTLGTDAPRIYRALVEATAFGSRAILERLLESGVEVERVIAIGGVARKSSLVMQILADVLNREILISASDQSVALGAAMFAAVAAGIHPSVEAAQGAMGAGYSDTYRPRPEAVRAYRGLYEKYTALGGFVEKSAAIK